MTLTSMTSDIDSRLEGNLLSTSFRLLSAVLFNLRIWSDVFRICSDHKMLVTFGRRTVFIALVFLISYVVSLRQYGSSSGSLYVAEDRLEKGPKIMNRFEGEPDKSQLERRKRDAAAPPTPAAQKNISTWVMIRFLIKFNLPPLLFRFV